MGSKENEHHLLAWSIDCQQQRDEIIIDMEVILEIINSNRKVEIEDYREFCKSTALLVKSEPWIKLHQLPCCASPQPWAVGKQWQLWSAKLYRDGDRGKQKIPKAVQDKLFS